MNITFSIIDFIMISKSTISLHVLSTYGIVYPIMLWMLLQ